MSYSTFSPSRNPIPPSDKDNRPKSSTTPLTNVGARRRSAIQGDDDDDDVANPSSSTAPINAMQRFQVKFFIALFLVGLGLVAISPLAAMISLLSWGSTSSSLVASPLRPSSPIPTITIDAVRRTYRVSTSPESSVLSYWAYEYSLPILRLQSTSNTTFLIRNNLGKETPESSTLRTMNLEMRYPNTTVTHFHGLHVSPSFNSDNMFRPLIPKDTLDYVLTLENHPAGTFWTHAHFHGSTALQTAFRLRFPLIVEDDANSVLRSAEEVVVLVGLGGRGSGHTSSDVETAFARAGSSMNEEESSNPIEIITVNDEVAPLSLTSLNPSKLYRVRLVNAAVDGVLRLGWHSEASPFGENVADNGDCPDVALIAVDGIYLRKGAMVGHRGLVLPPGGRADYILSLNGAQPCVLQSHFDSVTRANLGLKTKTIEGRLLALSAAPTLAHGLRTRPPPPRLPQSVPLLPAYMLEDLRNLAAHYGDSSNAVERRTIVFDEFIYDEEEAEGAASSSPLLQRPAGDERGSEPRIKYGVGGLPFSEKSRFAIRLGRIQEWTILNRRHVPRGFAHPPVPVSSPRPDPIEAHPFHMHTNHFQVVRDSHNINNHDEANWWRDTVVIPPLGNVTIRFRPLHFTGKSLLHCHTLSHSDYGMVMAFDIID